ncbi:MAG: hypothetical protein IPJ89_00360 [Candidatus Iainarchaeum archaeon]|uniref:Ribbon-helix-helix protein, CopG family n=1 Tax=Candidatus Iainarchaeum sp. TaxID=3101447 RepID=A0A7T9DK22_9ARCH|nr:MAG: hypothetical protein IPJ89_00360 [Candidatus Diapherotrites archaeon]
MSGRKLVITLNPSLKRGLEEASKRRKCSQAEIVRGLLYQNLAPYLKEVEADAQTLL